MVTILVVDDEAAIHRFLEPTLVAEGYRVVHAMTGGRALELAAAERPDLVLLDLGLPDLDGKEVLRRLRIWSSIPVVVLSARDREAEKIASLDLGADDFVNKPFGVGELLARLRAALRHARGTEPAEIRYGDLEIDLMRRQVTRAGSVIHLTKREFDLLALLARHAGSVMTHRAIMAAIWGPAHTEDTHYLRVYISQLRQKLGDVAGAGPILTEPGIGYRFSDHPA